MNSIEVRDLGHYQELAMETMNPSLDREAKLANTAMGLCGEAFELFELMHRRLDAPRDETRRVVHELPPYRDWDRETTVVGELGDVMWYVACLVDTIGENLDEVCCALLAASPWDTVKPHGDWDVAEVFYAAWVDLCLHGAKASEKIKKHLHQGHPFDEAMRRSVLSYVVEVVAAVQVMAAILDRDLREVCRDNATKLRKRYRGGKFSAEASIHRDS